MSAKSVRDAKNPTEEQKQNTSTQTAKRKWKWSSDKCATPPLLNTFDIKQNNKQFKTTMRQSILPLIVLLQTLVGHQHGPTVHAFSIDHQQQRVFVSTPSRPTNRIVSDLMTSEPHLFTLAPHTSVDDAIAMLLQAGVSGAPVVERLKNAETNKVDCRLVGFVSSFDFLPREESGILVTLGEMEDSETARRILGQTVQDIMTRDPVSVTTNDLMKTAAETMAKHR